MASPMANEVWASTPKYSARLSAKIFDQSIGNVGLCHNKPSLSETLGLFLHIRASFFIAGQSSMEKRIVSSLLVFS